METVKLLLMVSLSINVSLAMYFFPPMTLVWVLRKQKRGRMIIEFLRVNEKRPNVIRKSFRDFFFSTALFIFGIYLLANKRIRENPFARFVDNRLQTAMAVEIGNQLFRLVHPLVPNQDIKRSFSCTCYEIVTIFSLIIILIIKENNIFAVLTLVFEGGVIFSDISRVENRLNSDARAPGRLHVATLLGNLFATLSMRVVCPVVFLAFAIHNYNLLAMSYISLALFILNTIFHCTLVLFELVSVYESLRTAPTSPRRESCDVENDTAQPNRTTINNNVYSSFARATSLIAMNNLESHRAVAGRVSGIPQSLHASNDASRTNALDHANEIVIKNF